MQLSHNSRRVRKPRPEDTDVSHPQPLGPTSHLHRLSLLVGPFNAVRVFPNENGALCIYDIWEINVLLFVQGITIILRIHTRLLPPPYPNITGHLVVPNIHPSGPRSCLFRHCSHLTIGLPVSSRPSTSILAPKPSTFHPLHIHSTNCSPYRTF